MATFDGSVKTRTRVALDGDSFTPAMGALVGSGNQEDVLNHGTLNQNVTGNVTRIFMADETIETLGSQTETINGSRTATILGQETETLVGGRSTTIVGMLTENFVSGQMTVCLGPYNRTDVASVCWLCPSSTQINSGDWFECKATKGGAYLFRTTSVAYDVATRFAKTDICLNDFKLWGIQTKLQTLQSKMLAGLKNAVVMTTMAIEAARADINGIHPEVRAVRTSVGCEIAAPPTSMPGAQ